MCFLSVLFAEQQLLPKHKERKLEMVPISCSHFLLGIMVLLLALKDTDAYNNRGIKKVVVEDGDGVTVPTRKDMHNRKEIFVPITAEDTNGILGGRKMMMEERELTNKVKKEESMKSSEEKSKISGATSVGNSNHTWMGKLKMRNKLSNRSIHHHLKVNMGCFTALNADYHMAKTHPPRNN